MNITVTPKAEQVDRGLQTWIGYATAAVMYLAAVVLALIQAVDSGLISLPPGMYGLLVAVGGVLTAITGKNRSDQKVANIDAAGAAAAAALAPVPPVALAAGTAQVDAPVAIDVLPTPDEVR